MSEKLLEIKGLKKYYPIKHGILNRPTSHIKAVDDVTFDIYTGETLGIVGESGSGKSTMARTILRLLEPTDGTIIFEGRDLGKTTSQELRSVRKDMQFIFQDPYSSLNPRFSVQRIIEEPLTVQKGISKQERTNRVIEMLEKVGLSEDSRTKFPHEFSGGQRQRIGIARALAMKPKFIIGDEPVSALDVSVQAQVLNLMKDLQEELNLTYLFIAHDLSVVKHISDRIGVMYLGRLVEIGPKHAIYEDPLHPYTQALLSAVPRTKVEQRRERIRLVGEPPNPANPPTGCPFHTRCPLAFDRCKVERPELADRGDGRSVACHLV